MEGGERRKKLLSGTCEWFEVAEGGEGTEATSAECGGGIKN